jgi:hypothetical protein
MPLKFETREGLLVVSEQQIQAVVRHAGRQADLTAAALDETGLFPDRPTVLPAGFLLELAAVLELGLWERQGLRPYLDIDLPTYREAADELAARAKRGFAEFDGLDATPLSHRVLQAWMQHFAWEGPDLLQADFILGDVDEDQFANVLADFVWQHRKELSKLLNEKYGS